MSWSYPPCCRSITCIRWCGVEDEQVRQPVTVKILSYPMPCPQWCCFDEPLPRASAVRPSENSSNDSTYGDQASMSPSQLVTRHPCAEQAYSRVVASRAWMSLAILRSEPLSVARWTGSREPLPRRSSHPDHADHGTSSPARAVPGELELHRLHRTQFTGPVVRPPPGRPRGRSGRRPAARPPGPRPSGSRRHRVESLTERRRGHGDDVPTSLAVLEVLRISSVGWHLASPRSSGLSSRPGSRRRCPAPRALIAFVHSLLLWAVNRRRGGAIDPRYLPTTWAHRTVGFDSYAPRS